MNYLPQVSPRIAIAIAFLLRGIVQGSWYPRIPGVVADLQVNSAQLGVMFFLLALGNIAAFTIAARIIARIGTAKTQLIFALPFPIIIVGLSLAPGRAEFALGMLVFGLFTGAYDLSTSVQGAMVERRTGAPLISALYGFFSVGALAGSFSSGMIAQAHVPIPLHFSLLALITIPLTLLATRSMVADDMIPVPGTRRRRLPTIPPKALLPLGLTIVCIALAEETINNWAALYIREDLGASAVVGSFAYTGFAITTAAGRLLGDRVIGMIGVDRTLSAGAVLAACGIGFGTLVNQPWAIIVGYGFMGLGLSVVVPVTYRRANQVPGIAPASAVATVASIGFVGFLFGPLLIGAVANLVSLRGAISLVAAVVLGIYVLTRLNPSPEPRFADSIRSHEGDAP